jgi:lysophospholipid acyltransferase (LPLAT)-like uncharacterized protein
MSTKAGQKFTWWEKILLVIVPPLVVAVVKLLDLTYRVSKVEGKVQAEKEVARHEGRAVYCTWHQRMFYLCNYLGRLHVTIMMSKSKDGEWVARIADYFGYMNVRGSSAKGDEKKGGSEAWHELVERVRDGENAGMFLDGPRGPAREAKIGAVLIARETGAPIIPVLWGCDRAWVFNSWDRYMIPKPFAKIYFKHGDPIYVPADASREELEGYRKQLEDQMNKDCLECDDFFGVKRPLHKMKKLA